MLYTVMGARTWVQGLGLGFQGRGQGLVLQGLGQGLVFFQGQGLDLLSKAKDMSFKAKAKDLKIVLKDYLSQVFESLAIQNTSTRSNNMVGHSLCTLP